MQKPVSLALFLSLAGAGVAAGQVAPVSAPARGGSLFPGDAVKVQIWQEPDLSGVFRVDQDTTLTLPLLGERSAAGLSTEELRQRLVSDYSGQLKNPSIDVTVLRRVSVIGEVASPGLYDVEPSMRLGDVIALAGGVQPEGNVKNVDILRGGTLVADDVELGEVIGDRVRSGDQLIVQQNSWWSRNGERIAIGVGTTVFAVVMRAVVFD